MIPRKFVRKYGECLSNKVVLKVPNGTEWKVYLEKHDDETWFQNGWKEFVEHHSLQHGDLLVFRFEGTSHFNVTIFDMSATEIDYPVKNKYGKRQRPNTSEEHLLACKNKRDEGFENSGTIEVSKGTFFTTTIKAINQGSCALWIPKGSLEGYIKPGKQNVTLLVGERSSKLRLIHYQKYSRSCIIGWTKFAREAGFNVGDTCSFKLLASDCEEIAMKVSICKRSTIH
ncbi:hypothetical protein PIB30_088990 [Stylosanthes scabra]|uniref:TF-B3 domain-containing protein n=1 Tax=Stylosanthes scabra TaxID=79078 RepID=A0ABU6SW71_9FABA|nr:hypothetical protein [Stylosanthes scabra]